MLKKKVKTVIEKALYDDAFVYDVVLDLWIKNKKGYNNKYRVYWDTLECSDTDDLLTNKTCIQVLLNPHIIQNILLKTLGYTRSTYQSHRYLYPGAPSILYYLRLHKSSDTVGVMYGFKQIIQDCAAAKINKNDNN